MTHCTRCRLILATIVCAVAVCSDGTVADAALVRFRSRVVITGRIITLGDIAEVTDPKSEVIARLESIPLAPAPAAGRERRIAYETVRSRLSAVGVNPAEVEFAGSSVVTVSVASREQTRVKPVGRIADRVPAWKIKQGEQLLAKAIGRYVARRAPGIGNVTVAVRLDPRDVSAVLDGWTYGFELRGGTGDLTGTQVLNLRVMDRHSRIQELAVRCTVTPVPRIVVARYTLPSGHLIQPADLTWRRSAAGVRGLTRMEAVVNKETRKPIRQGAPILPGDIRVVPLIRPNEIVTVRSRVGGIVVSSRMKSRTAGTRGETVTLATLDGRRRIQARVTGYHEAEVLAIGNPGTPRGAATTGNIRFQHLPARAQADQRGVPNRAGLRVFRSRRSGQPVRPVSGRASVPVPSPRRSGRLLRPDRQSALEAEGVSEWRSLEPRRAVGRADRPVPASSEK